jgi:hypothetical protein
MFSLITFFSVIMATCQAGTLRGAELEKALQEVSAHQIPTLEVWRGGKIVWEGPMGTPKAPEVGGIMTIVAIGKAAWNLVKDNKPVVDYNSDWAGAVPQEYYEDWTSLEGWKDKESDEFRFHYKVAGDTVSELKWKFVWSYGGHDKDGRGAYVLNAGAHLDNAYARAGQWIEADVKVHDPVNYGDTEQPIGGVDIEVKFKSTSNFNSATTTCTFTCKGDGSSKVQSCKGNDP